MSTAPIAAADDFGFALSDKLAAGTAGTITHLKSLASGTYASVVESTVVTTTVGYARSIVKGAWIYFKAIGLATLALNALTSNDGREFLLLKAPGFIYRMLMTPVRFVGRQVARLTSRCGKHAAAITRTVPVIVERSEETVAKGAHKVNDTLKASHDGPLQSTIQSVTSTLIFVRMARWFLPAGWMRLAAYAVIPFLPTDRRNNGQVRNILSTTLDLTVGTKDDGPITNADLHIAEPETVPSPVETMNSVIPPAASPEAQARRDRLASDITADMDHGAAPAKRSNPRSRRGNWQR